MASRFFYDSLLGRWCRRRWHGWWRFVRQRFYENREYTALVPFGNLVYSPWFDPKNEVFQSFMEQVRDSGPSIVSRDRCYILHQMAKHGMQLQGAFAECGTYAGGTALLLALTIQDAASLQERSAPALHLFDSFEGMPEILDKVRDHHAKGDFGDTSLEFVKRRLRDFDFVTFHPGFMPDTFAVVESVTEYAFVYVDVDIYPSIHECCKWFWPRLEAGGVLLFDDYGFHAYRNAARRAIDEYFATQSVPVLALPTGQALVIKPPRNVHSQASPPSHQGGMR